MKAAVALGIVVAVIVMVVMAGGNRPQPEAPPSLKTVEPTPPKPTEAHGGIEIAAPVKLVVECESADKLDDTEPKSGQKIFLRKKVSMGKPIEFLEIPDGWIKSCGLEDEKGQPGSLPGRAEYIVDVPRDDDYYLFLRAKWHDSCGNSVYLQLNGADWFTIEDTEGEVDKTTYKWAWHALRDGSAPRAIPLKKGPNRLVLAPKEDGPMLDKILIGTDATQPAPETMDP